MSAGMRPYRGAAAPTGPVWDHASVYTNACSCKLSSMALTSWSFAMPNDPELLARLAARLGADGEPPVALRRTSLVVLAFESATGETMLRSRVIQALSDVVGPDWHDLVTPLAQPDRPRPYQPNVPQWRRPAP